MWVELVSPLLEMMGIEPTDYVSHKRFLSLFVGGMLPVISLSFLHMLVKFTEEDREKKNNDVESKVESESVIDSSDLIGEVSKIRLSDEDLKKLEHFLNNPPKPNDNLINAAKKYQELIEDEDDLVSDDEINEIYSTSSNIIKIENNESINEEVVDTVIDSQITDAITSENHNNNEVISDIETEEKKKN
jgi:hypothetical protein